MSKLRNFLASWAALSGLIVFAPLALAQNVAFTLNDPTVFAADSSQGTGGLFFTVGANPINVTAFGYFDYGANGLDVPHAVGIFDTAQNLLASVNIATPGATLDGAFQYVNLATPLTLQANTQYVLVGQDVANAVDPQNNSGILSVAPGIASFDGYSYISNTTNLTYPTTPFAPPYVGPNLQFTVIPEPSAYAAILGVATLGLAAVRRGRCVRLRA